MATRTASCGCSLTSFSSLRFRLSASRLLARLWCTLTPTHAPAYVSLSALVSHPAAPARISPVAVRSGERSRRFYMMNRRVSLAGDVHCYPWPSKAVDYGPCPTCRQS